ncbi:hypothetical protein BDR07DRAFT_1422211 [Suillus spraguei]|nr:hypothetical protein BDR07DRAFT_1422211 [Suillus spraguei]
MASLEDRERFGAVVDYPSRSAYPRPDFGHCSKHDEKASQGNQNKIWSGMTGVCSCGRNRCCPVPP